MTFWQKLDVWADRGMTIAGLVFVGGLGVLLFCGGISILVFTMNACHP